MDNTNKRKRSGEKKTLLGDEIHKLKEMHKSGLNFSQIEKQMGICRQAISKYITGPNQQIQLPVNIREPTRHIATVEVMTALEYFKTKKPSTTYHEIQQNLVENGICLQQNVPGTSQLSKCCVHNLGFTYKKLKQIPIETSSYDIQRKFEN